MPGNRPGIVRLITIHARCAAPAYCQRAEFDPLIDDSRLPQLHSHRRTSSPANTNVIPHAARLSALFANETIADDACGDGARFFMARMKTPALTVRRREFRHHINMFRRRVQRRNTHTFTASLQGKFAVLFRHSSSVPDNPPSGKTPTIRPEYGQSPFSPNIFSVSRYVASATVHAKARD